MLSLRQAEWGFVYNGSVLISAVDEDGKYQVEKLNYGDIWYVDHEVQPLWRMVLLPSVVLIWKLSRYFPKGAAHTVQGLDDENEFLLVFDEADFDKVG